MKIKMRTKAAGPDCVLHDGRIYEVGVSAGLTAEFAEDLLKGGYAEPAPEVAVKPEEGETAVDEEKAAKKAAQKAKKAAKAKEKRAAAAAAKKATKAKKASKS